MITEAAPTIRKLYPDLNDAELLQAEDNLDRYLALVLRVFERLESETDPHVSQLTARAGTVESSCQEVSA